MSDATVAGAARAWASDDDGPVGTPATLGNVPVTGWDLPDARRALQLALAGAWLLDAVLQMQPFMFSSAFGRMLLASSAIGNPATVARAIAWSGREIGIHPGLANAAFCVVQLAIALGIAVRATTRAALAGSVAWSALVWWIGEGFGGILSGQATPVTGAPGAVLVYGLLAVLLWPTGSERCAEEVSPAAFVAAQAVGERVARATWLVFWGVMAGLSLESGALTPNGLSEKIAAMSTGEPRWLSAIAEHGASLVAGDGGVVSVSLAVVFALVAVSTLAPPAVARTAILAVIVVALAIWVVGESLGGILSGVSTDPSSGLLLILLAFAYWPSSPRREADTGVAAREAVA
jgi:hypothetical protein